MTGAPLLEARALAVGYRGGRRATVVLDGLDLALPAGELTCLLGPNGSGKSTLLRTLAGLQPALAGSVRLLGDELRRLPPLERARRLAVVLTDRPDVGLMRAVDVVALGRHPHTGWAGRLRDRDRAAVRWALRVTGAEPLAARPVAELSDGERQRVLVARALAQEPAVLALDEPVAFVDVPRRVELVGLLRRLARDCGLAVVLTTHDLELAVRAADRLWLVEPRPAERSVVHDGAPEDLVLSGAVARAFHSAEVVFDLARGTFHARRAAGPPVRVCGSGPPAVWAARALERAGYTPLAPGAGGAARARSDDAGLRVEACATAAGARWRLYRGAAVAEHDTIGALLADLRPAPPGERAPGTPGAGAGERGAAPLAPVAPVAPQATEE